MNETNKTDNYYETLNSDHLLHENRVLRKVIKEKNEEIEFLKKQIEVKNRYKDEFRNYPYGY